MSRRLTLQNASIWTGGGANALVAESLEIEDGRIVQINGRNGGHDGVVVDCGGRWVIPGLIDCHLHFFGARCSDPMQWLIDPPLRGAIRAVEDSRKVLEAGFTTVRDAGSRVGPALAEAVDSGEFVGPRVIPAWLGISRTGGHGDIDSIPQAWVRDHPWMALIADGPEECRRSVREIARSGGRWVKLWASGGVLSGRDRPSDTHLSASELQVIVEEARAVGLPVGAHATGVGAVKDCVLAGVDTIEHGFDLDEEACRLMSERNVTLVTTLSFLKRAATAPDTVIPRAASETVKEMLQHGFESVELAHAAGVTIALGTDSFAEPLTPFGQNADELLYLNEAGLSPEECLLAATASASGVCGLSDTVGTLSEGMNADLVILNKTSPLEDLSTLVHGENIQLVMKSGVPVAGSNISGLMS